MDVIAFFQSANIFLSVSSDGGYCLTLLLLPDIKQFQQQGRNPSQHQHWTCILEKTSHRSRTAVMQSSAPSVGLEGNDAVL